MKKVLIVDDEFLVRLGLKTTIDWESHGYVIAGEASNGKEALELFDKINPDILLTDIKMPIMDGFQLIEEIRKKKKNTQVVILSHYDEFSYAQKALRMGALQYILKSEMNEANLIDLLHNLQSDSKEEVRASSQKQNSCEEYLMEQLFGKAADDDLTPSTLTLPKKDLFPEAFHVILKGFCDTSMLTEDSGAMLSDTVKSLLDSTFDGAITSSSYYKKQFYFTTILQPQSHNSGREAWTSDRARQLIRNIRQYFDVVVQIGISRGGMPERFPEMLHEAEKARKSCFFTSDGIGIYGEFATGGKDQVKVSHTKLSVAIEENKHDALMGYIREVFENIRLQTDYAIFKSAFIDFLAIAKSICEVYHLGQAPSLPETKFSYDTVNAIPFIETAQKYVEDLYLAIADAKETHEPSYSSAVRACIGYIKKHYNENISLTDAATASDISSSYLSLIFKQETGVNFSNYLTEFRVEQAKKMLAGTNRKIYEIAEDVGFSSPYYFSKVFKEVTGLTCKEYKDKYSKSGVE